VTPTSASSGKARLAQEKPDAYTHDAPERDASAPLLHQGAEDVQPAGTYIVETDEELLEGLSFPAYHRVSTSMILPVRGGGSGSYEVIRINPAELEQAQRRDAEG
jgi:hypothetical protein